MRIRAHVPARLAAILATLCATALSPLAAQGPDSTRAATADTSRATAPSTSLSGPRVQAKWQRYEPSLAPRASERALPQEGETHTIKLTTLAIILIAVIVLLLLVR